MNIKLLTIKLFQLILGLGFFINSSQLFGQIPASSYGFTPISGTYSEMSGGTNITSIQNDDALSSLIPIGFTFNYCGVNYTKFKICSNGYITFDSTLGTYDYTLSNDIENMGEYVKPGLMFLFDDLSGGSSTDGTPSAKYLVTGTSPNQVITIQLKNWRWNYNSSPQVNIQIKLYQTTNVIEYIYSPVSGATPIDPSATIGIVDGQSTPTWLSLNNTSASPTASSTTFTTNLASSPVSGQTYRWTPPAPCSEQPSAGTVSTPDSVCPNVAIYLSTTGSTIATGLSGQWQLSNTGLPGSWTAINGATTNNFLYTTGISTPTYFRYYTTCASSTLSDTSAIKHIFIKPYEQCYCTPIFTYDCTDAYIDNFTLDGYSQNISTLNTGCSNNSYASYLTNVANGYQGQTYYGTATTNYPYNDFYLAIWIDFNNDGNFSTSERVYMSPNTISTNTPINYSFSIPLTATAGNHRLRVRMVAYEPDIDACETYSFGETQDYMFNVITLPACTGSPSAGLVASQTMCPYTPFSLTANGTTVASGISRQWQTSPSPNGPWTNIAGATTQVYFSNGIQTTKYYRHYVVCNGTNSDTSAVASVNIVGGPQCYCTPNITNNYGEYGLTNVTTTGGIKNINKTTVQNTYSNYTTTDTIAGVQGMSINYSIKTTDNYTRYAIYIDWNQNGSFNDPGDTVFYMQPSTSSPGTNTFSGTFQIPSNATSGHTRMRVRTTYYYNYSYYTNAPCGTSNEGEIEDYDFYVIQQTPCSGTPYGTANASSLFVCSGQSVNLNLTNYPYTNSNITYQWQMSDSGTGNWNNISTQLSTPYFTSPSITNVKQFRCKIRCLNTNDTFLTNIVTVHLNNFYNCYCSPSSGSGSSYYITNLVTNGGIININNPSTSSIYSDFTNSDTAGGVRGMSINYTVTKSSANTRYAMYIDWNHNGSFNDPGDTIHYDPIATNPNLITATGIITIPNTAALGHTRMRLRSSRYGTSTTNYTSTPCAYANYAEAEDYDFYVMPCPITDTIHSSFASICPGGSVTLNATTNTDTASFAWNTGATGNSITVNTAGTYIATATSALCAVSDTFVLNQGFKDSLYITPDSPTICGGYPAIIKAHSSYPNAQFTWNTGEATDSLIVGTATTYTVTTTVAGQAGCGNEASIEVTSSPSPFAEIILVTNAGNNNPLEINARALHVANTNTYVWDFGDGTVETNTDSVVNHTYNMAGHYTISLAIVNECDTSFLTRDFDLDMSTGVNDIDITNQDVNLFPNPATEEVNIVNKLDNSKMKHITIFNALGQVIYSKDANSANRHQLNINSFASGIYSVRIDLDKGVAIRKLQITK